MPIQNDSEDLSAELLPELSEFSSSVHIKTFLARLLILITKGRVSPRRASVMAYVTNQLLHSHRAISRDNLLQTQKEKDEPLVLDFSHWPGPRMNLASRDPPAMSVPSKLATFPTPDPRPPRKRTESWKQISLLPVLIVEWG